MDFTPCTLYQDPNVTLPTEEDYRRCGCFACRTVLRHLEHVDRTERENDALVMLLVAIARIARSGVDINASIGAELEAYRDACKKNC